MKNLKRILLSFGKSILTEDLYKRIKRYWGPRSSYIGEAKKERLEIFYEREQKWRGGIEKELKRILSNTKIINNTNRRIQPDDVYYGFKYEVEEELPDNEGDDIEGDDAVELLDRDFDDEDLFKEEPANNRQRHWHI